MRRASFLALMGITVGLTTALPASAGVPDCGNIRFEGLSNCEVVLTAECNASCDELGIYKTACATKLVPVCQQQCTLSATPTCTDSCTTQCQTDCDNGVNVICSHNCFAECTVSRDVDCASAADPTQCSATWDANCDAECDAQCVTVDGGCYQHCIECCDGSCTADANMDCQTTCQDVEFEQCEQEFRASCQASCTGDGALFCDGTYIVSGSQIEACVKALAAEGIEVKAEASVSLGPDGVEGDLTAGICAFSPAKKASFGAPFAALAAAAAWLARRRKRSSRKPG
jgi:MYXO-CTERM domain-containing protein